MPGQIVTLTGSVLDTASDVVFQVVDASGNRSDLVVRPTARSTPPAPQAQVRRAARCRHRRRCACSVSTTSVTLQIVAAVSDVQVESVAADGLDRAAADLRHRASSKAA